jgi:hypothetical protein
LVNQSLEADFAEADLPAVGRIDGEVTAPPPVLAWTVKGCGTIELAKDVRAPQLFGVRGDLPEGFWAIKGRIGAYKKPEIIATNLQPKDGTAVDWKTVQRLPLDSWLLLGLTFLVELRTNGFWHSPLRFPPGFARDVRLERARLAVIDCAGGQRPRTPEQHALVRRICADAKYPIKALEQWFPGYNRSTYQGWRRQAERGERIGPARTG